MTLKTQENQLKINIRTTTREVNVEASYTNFFNVYLFLRDRAQAGEGQRERETQNGKQAPGSEPSA